MSVMGGRPTVIIRAVNMRESWVDGMLRHEIGKHVASVICVFIYLGVLLHFQHCRGHITMGNYVGRGN